MIDDGGPIFPFPGMGDATGMTLRDYVAGQFLVAIVTCQAAQEQLELAIREQLTNRPEEDRRKVTREIIAKRCYLQADAMIAERSKASK